MTKSPDVRSRGTMNAASTLDKGEVQSAILAVIATRIGKARFLTDNREVFFIVSVAGWIGVPILVAPALRRWIVTRRLFLGQRY